MIKRYSENRLKRINFFSYFYFSWSVVKKLTMLYENEIDKENKSFHTKLNILKKGKQSEIQQLTKLFSTAILFRQNKKLRKEITTQFYLFICVIIIFLLPGIIFKFSSKLERTIGEFLLVYVFSVIVLITVGLITVGILNFISNFEVRIGKALKNLLETLFIAGIISLVNATDYMTDSLIKWSILSGLMMLYIVIAFSIFIFLTKAFIDFRFYSQKILITDALILESSFRLSNMNWPIVIRRRTQRQDALNELERLARLIENDWSLHLKTGDEKTTKWKNDTFKGIAEGIRSLKKQIIQPDPETPTQLKSAFEGIFQKIVNHDIKGLVGAEVPVMICVILTGKSGQETKRNLSGNLTKKPIYFPRLC